VTVGPGITPGLLTLPPFTAIAVSVTKRSRAMRIARNYRRWGIAPRPENVSPPFIGRRSVFITDRRAVHCAFMMIAIGFFEAWKRLFHAQGLINPRHARSNSSTKRDFPC